MKSLYKTTGIYAIQNKITGMAYVGQTTNNFGDRRDCNFAKLRHNKHENVGLQEDWNKYGEQNYEFKILETLEDCVVYRQLYGEGNLWIRKEKDFLSEVDHAKYPDIKQKYRFELQNIKSLKK